DCSLLSGPGAPDDAQTHLGGVVHLDQAAECRSHADIFDEHRLRIDLIKLLETLEDDRRGQLCALLRAEAAVGDLSFSLPTGTIAERDLEFARTWCAGPAADVYAIIGDLLKAHLREVRDDIGGDVGGRVGNFIEELFGTGADGDLSSGAVEFADDGLRI